MDWMDVAGIVFACVTMNHLGLIGKIEEIMGKELLILNCPKCSSFWSVLIYTAITSHSVVTPFATSFLASYVAIWLELLEAYIDTLYLRLYDKIYPTSDNTAAASPDKGNTPGSVS